MRLISRSFTGSAAALVVGTCFAGAASALPAPGPLAFAGATPKQGSVVTASSVNVVLTAACSFDEGSLAVTLNGSPIPQGDFLPFSSCVDGRKTSQVANVALTLPNASITGAPSNLSAGDSANFSGSGTGDSLSWNFDGGAEPVSGSPVNATFNAAGSFTVRLRALNDESLAASGMANGDLVSDTRDFQAGDPTPASQVVSVQMPPDVDFRNYETAHTHPVALSEDDTRLYAVNTPEGRLAIFDVAAGGDLTFAGDVAVGLDPVSLAVRPGTNEVWVANHLSDSVSIVDVSQKKVLATLAVGDEPTDVVFASGRAFVSLAGSQDRVQVYNAATRALVTTIDILGDDPRAMAVNTAGTEVYLVVLESGNQTTALFHRLVDLAGGPPAPNPPRAGGMGAAPEVGLIVQFNPATGDWEDETGDDWSNQVDFAIADNDLLIIDADAGTPSVIDTVQWVGTTLFDVAVRPGSSEVWVPNTEARNLIRFETNLRGQFIETRISKVNPGTGSVTPIDINSHINYGVTPGPPAEIAGSLAHPGDGVFASDGQTFYLTALGSNKVGVLNANADVVNLIDVGEGPSGVALNETDGKLYVVNRFANSISIVDTTTESETGVVGVGGPSPFDPSPDVVKIGRKFLYDAQISSGHGDTSCASCHIFSNFDNIAWDLGEPQGEFVDYDETPWVGFGPGPFGASTSGFDPMKGPMTTQTLRGLMDLEPFHWRGDRENFQHFNGAFVNLMGMAGFCSLGFQACDPENPCPSGQSCLGLTQSDMDAYTAFIETVNFPPNPFRNLDNSLPTSIPVPSQNGGGQTASGNPQQGSSDYSAKLLDAGFFSCNNCHTLPTGSNNLLFNGGLEGETQDFKIPHLRNMYEKVGFDVIRPSLQSGNATNSDTNIGLPVQKRGFGFLHDGSISLTEFLAASIFTSTTQEERDMFAFMLAFPTESKPSVGYHVTATTTAACTSPTLTTLIFRAVAGDCDIAVRGVVGSQEKGYVYDPGTNRFIPDSMVEQPLTRLALCNTIGSGDVLTFLGVPPGAGRRMAIDRDRDTWPDRTEVALGFDPANPNSNPWEFQ